LIPAAPRPWRRALAWLAFLAPFFFLTYGFANWAAARHGDLPAIVFGWESAIPFVPWTIVPYWSIDALYGISLFVCATRGELDAHVKRLLTAQLVAVACFLAVPHRFTFTHPPVDGVAGALFDFLGGFDLPYNQVPSLHIALAVILWTLYARYCRGLARILLDVWFIVIGASVLTTYQHHFVDLPTGFVLGWLCVWLWPLPDSGWRSPAGAWRYSRDPARHRLAALYALGALACAIVATLAGGAGLWLWWPALSLALVALAYAGLGAALFEKDAGGQLSLAARWLLAPYLAGAWINSRLWTRSAPQAVEVADGVWIGRTPAAREQSRFAGIVDVTAEMSLPRAPTPRRVVPMLDLVPPDARELSEATHAIEALRAKGPVLVCCALGYSRSACSVAAWLMATGRADTTAAAFARVRAARSQVVLDARHAAALHASLAP
jgi:membrane-associated phospholipid phosphatase